MTEALRDRLNLIRERIARAAERSGRRAEHITLIGVTKTFSADVAQQAVDAGLHDLGENKVQEAEQKTGDVSGPVRWHLIGHLQSNKVRPAVRMFDVIHTIDGRSLVERLDRIAGEEGKRPIVLAQVDLADESTKSGIAEGELGGLVESLDAARNLDFRGLMTLPPFLESRDEIRPYFRRLRELRDALNRNRPSEMALTELSMGMSHDFEVAIEEGATMVRIGTAIFGSREPGLGQG